MSKDDDDDATDFARALEVLTGLGFRVESIMPADDPAMAETTGHGIRLRLRRDAPAPPAGEASAWAAFLVVTRNDPAAWRVGRAGMQYRDLIPDRLGGRVIASHIRIPEGGPVADYVHFHAIRFQMTYCYKGWVRLVYEDQGEPFVMRAGECVLQPPNFDTASSSARPDSRSSRSVVRRSTRRTRTMMMSLPTPSLRLQRNFGGQRFVWDRSTADGIATASGGVASVRVVHGATRTASVHLEGAMTVTCEDASERVSAGAAFVVPAQRRFELRDGTPDLAWLEVALPPSPP